MKTIATLSFSLMVFVYCSLNAANRPSSAFATGFLHPKDWAFEENLGQLSDHSGNTLPEIKYFGSFGGTQVYCTGQKLSFVFFKKTEVKASDKLRPKLFIKPVEPSQSMISASRLDLEFEGSNQNVKIIAHNRQQRTANYATAQVGTQGISGVGFYKELTYINLYDHIDMVVIANEKGLEYEFIVHPGGNTDDIKLVRNGADAMETLKDGGIKYSTSFGILQETKPQSYSASQSIGSYFIRSGNKLSFKTEKYDRNKDLVIDPGLTWSTYFGGDSDDESKSIALDASGNVYIAGLTNSLIGLATKGAYQTTLAGGKNYDAFIAKFSGTGNLIWATYYGGDSVDYETGCALDNSGNVFLTGTTLSKNGIATKGAYQTSLGSKYWNSFLAKFDKNGALTWATYFGGGTADVNAYKVAVDDHGNPYIAGYAANHTNISTKGSFQTGFGGGNYDAFIAKFSGKGSLDWATYFGGSGDDYALGIDFDNLNNFYVTGTTTSTNVIATSGAYKSTCDVNYGNAFVAAFDSNGVQKWGTYFGGKGGGDVGYCLATNHKDKIYITGFTANTFGVATNGAYQTVFNGTSEVFLADFNTSGTINWATYYGGNGDQTAFGVSGDTSGNIYITGLTSSTNQIATSSGAQTSNRGSIANAFLAKFDSSGTLKYGTYYGGTYFDQAETVANDNSGNVYITGLTASSGIATSGAYQTAYAGGSGSNPYDAFVAKFIICDLSTSITGITATCGNSTTSYKTPPHANSSYSWTVSGGSIQTGTGTDSITVKWNSSGSGSVNEQETNSISGCSDKASLTVNIAPMIAPVITGNTTVCPLTSYSYRVSPVSGVSYSWTVNNGNITTLPGRDSIEVIWPSIPGTGTVSIKESSGGGACVSGDTINIIIDPKPIAHVKIIANGKGVYKFISIDSSFNSSGYSWTINGAKYNGYHVQKTFHHDSVYHFSLIVTNPAGCTNQLDSTINVSDAGITINNPENLNMSLFPNPFKDQVEIHYSITDPGTVQIEVYDMLGKKVAVVQNKHLSQGNYTSVFDAKSINLTDGMYFVTMRANGAVETQRIVRAKN